MNYYFNATDGSENILISIDINPKDPFYVEPTIFTGGQTFVESYIISDAFTKSDIGVYTETISVSDQEFVDTKEINITIVEINNPPVVNEIGAQTVWTNGSNTTFYKPLDVSDVESGNRTSGNLSFVLTFLTGTKFFDIDNDGVMNFTSNESIIGSYNISVCTTDMALDVIPANISYCGQDGLNQTTCKNFSLAVTNENRAPTISSYSPASIESVAGTTALNFNANYLDLDGNVPDASWYIDDELKELVIGSSSDSFSYTFGCGVSGDYTAELIVTDGLLNTSVSWSFEVTNVDCSVATGGGGGGGGSSTTTPEEEIILEKFDIDFSNVSEKTIEVQQEDIKTFSFNNRIIHTITVMEKTGNSVKLMIKSEPIIVILNLLETKQIDMNGDGLDDIGIKFVYTTNGYVELLITKLGGADILSLEELEKAAMKKALFDVKVEMVERFKAVLPEEEVIAKIDLLNVNHIGKVDVVIDYYLSDGEKILTQGSDSLAVEAVVSFVRSLIVPEDTKPGQYFFEVDLTYKDFKTSGKAEFRVKSEAESVIEKNFREIIIVLILLIGVILIGYLIWMRKNMQGSKVGSEKFEMSSTNDWVVDRTF